MLARKITLAQDLERIGGDLGLTVGRSDGRTRRVRTATAEEAPYGRRRLRESSPSTTSEPLRSPAVAGVVALHHESTKAGGISVRARGRGKRKGARGAARET